MCLTDKGVWSLTVGPLAPGFCTYGYAIYGGLRMPDPSNPNLELRRWGPTSIFIVPGPEKAIFEERHVPHGAIHGQPGHAAHVLCLYASGL
jgi:hypothetical protein